MASIKIARMGHFRGGLQERVRPVQRSGEALHRDTGCEVAPSCLSCPLPACIHDAPGSLRRIFVSQRQDRIARLKATGASINAIAETERVSRRTVFRLLAEARP